MWSKMDVATLGSQDSKIDCASVRKLKVLLKVQEI